MLGSDDRAHADKRLPPAEKAIAQARGGVIGIKGTLPAKGDQSNVPAWGKGMIDIVGQPPELAELLTAIAVPYVERHKSAQLDLDAHRPTGASAWIPTTRGIHRASVVDRHPPQGYRQGAGDFAVRREWHRALTRLCCKQVRRVVPVLLVLLTAAPQAALAGQWYRCRYSGKTRKSCCCGEKAQSDPPRQAEVKRSSCCDVLRNHPRVVNARTEAGAERVGPATLLAVRPVPAHALVLVRGYELDPIQRATAPPPAAPAYIRHSALLL